MSAKYLSYTYLIGWTEHDTWYYGVRTANKHEPENDLWVHYFTSSKLVSEFRKLHGEPDVIQVDKTFDDNRKAYFYEVEKLHEFDVLNESKWLNQKIGGSRQMTDAERKNLSMKYSGEGNPFYGKKHTDETKAKMSLARKQRIISKETREKLSKSISGERNPFYGKKHTDEAKAKMRLEWQKRRLKGIPFHSKETRQRISEASRRSWEKRKAKQAR